MIKPVSFRWSTELVARIDLRRGDVPRSVWVRRAVERALSEPEGPTRQEQADPGPVPSPEGVRSAAPAEQLPPDLERIVDGLTEAGVLSAGVSPPRPISHRVPSRRDVKPFQRGDK